MGLAKDIVACLAKWSCRFKINCKSKCISSDCMMEEGEASHPSPVLTVKNMQIHEEKASAHISTL